MYIFIIWITISVYLIKYKLLIGIRQKKNSSLTGSKKQMLIIIISCSNIILILTLIFNKNVVYPIYSDIIHLFVALLFKKKSSINIII